MKDLFSLTLYLVGWNLGRMENVRKKMGWKTEFSSVWEWEENRGSGKPGRKFSLPGPQIFSSQIGRKSNDRKLPQCSFTVMLSHQPFIQDLHLPHRRLLPQILITVSHLLIFTFSTSSTVPGSLLFFFFFFNVITARTPSILEIVKSAIIPHNDLSANYLWYKLFFFFLRKYLI